MNKNQVLFYFFSLLSFREFLETKSFFSIYSLYKIFEMLNDYDNNEKIVDLIVKVMIVQNNEINDYLYERIKNNLKEYVDLYENKVIL